MKRGAWFLILFLMIAVPHDCFAQRRAEPPAVDEYSVGIGDVLDIEVLQPDKLSSEVTVAPDGTIAFAYIGSVPVAGKGLTEIQRDIQERLSDGYMRYPVVTVSLKSSESKKFFVYGEVTHPGPFLIEEN